MLTSAAAQSLLGSHTESPPTRASIASPAAAGRRPSLTNSVSTPGYSLDAISAARRGTGTRNTLAGSNPMIAPSADKAHEVRRSAAGRGEMPLIMSLGGGGKLSIMSADGTLREVSVDPRTGTVSPRAADNELGNERMEMDSTGNPSLAYSRKPRATGFTPYTVSNYRDRVARDTAMLEGMKQASSERGQPTTSFATSLRSSSPAPAARFGRNRRGSNSSSALDAAKNLRSGSAGPLGYLGARAPHVPPVDVGTMSAVGRARSPIALGGATRTGVMMGAPSPLTAGSPPGMTVRDGGTEHLSGDSSPPRHEDYGQYAHHSQFYATSGASGGGGAAGGEGVYRRRAASELATSSVPSRGFDAAGGLPLQPYDAAYMLPHSAGGGGAMPAADGGSYSPLRNGGAASFGYSTGSMTSGSSVSYRDMMTSGGIGPSGLGFDAAHAGLQPAQPQGGGASPVYRPQPSAAAMQRIPSLTSSSLSPEDAPPAALPPSSASAQVRRQRLAQLVSRTDIDTTGTPRSDASSIASASPSAAAAAAGPRRGRLQHAATLPPMAPAPIMNAAAPPSVAEAAALAVGQGGYAARARGTGRLARLEAANMPAVPPGVARGDSVTAAATAAAAAIDASGGGSEATVGEDSRRRRSVLARLNMRAQASTGGGT